MWVALEDHYALLGVSRNATSAELRRAYRLLALKLHPDRAGYGSTMMFQRLVEAYQVLSDPEARAAYDRRLDETMPPPGAPAVGARARAVRRETLMARLSGPIEVLLGRAAARRAPDGVIELLLDAGEARSGGTAALEVPVEITCPTCSGVAARHRVWCQRCEYAGSVVDVVAVAVQIPPAVPDRTGYVFPIDPQGNLPPLRVRLRVTAW